MQGESKKRNTIKKPEELKVVPEKPDHQNIPDGNTAKDPVFFSGGAPNQIFRLELGIVSYGTDDKSHAASLILSVIAGMLLLILFIGGFFVDRAWISDALKILGTVFTMVVGVAVGKSSSGK